MQPSFLFKAIPIKEAEEFKQHYHYIVYSESADVIFNVKCDNGRLLDTSFVTDVTDHITHVIVKHKIPKNEKAIRDQAVQILTSHKIPVTTPEWAYANACIESAMEMFDVGFHSALNSRKPAEETEKQTGNIEIVKATLLWKVRKVAGITANPAFRNGFMDAKNSIISIINNLNHLERYYVKYETEPPKSEVVSFYAFSLPDCMMQFEEEFGTPAPQIIDIISEKIEFGKANEFSMKDAPISERELTDEQKEKLMDQVVRSVGQPLMFIYYTLKLKKGFANTFGNADNGDQFRMSFEKIDNQGSFSLMQFEKIEKEFERILSLLEKNVKDTFEWGAGNWTVNPVEISDYVNNKWVEYKATNNIGKYKELVEIRTIKKDYIVKEDMICPETGKYCYDECCMVGSECNLKPDPRITAAPAPESESEKIK